MGSKREGSDGEVISPSWAVPKEPGPIAAWLMDWVTWSDNSKESVCPEPKLARQESSQIDEGATPHFNCYNI